MAIGKWEMGEMGFHPNSLIVRNVSALHEGVQQTLLDDPASTCHIFDYDGTLSRDLSILSRVQGEALVYTARPFVGPWLRRKLRKQRENLHIISGIEKLFSQRRLLSVIDQLDGAVTMVNYYGNTGADIRAADKVAQTVSRRNHPMQVRYFHLRR